MPVLQDDVSALRAEQQDLIQSVSELRHLLQSAVMPALLSQTQTGAAPMHVSFTGVQQPQQQQRMWQTSPVLDVQSFTFPAGGAAMPGQTTTALVNADDNMQDRGDRHHRHHRHHRSSAGGGGGGDKYAGTGNNITISPVVSSTQVEALPGSVDPRVSGSTLPRSSVNVGVDGGEKERRGRRSHRKPPPQDIVEPQL